MVETIKCWWVRWVRWWNWCVTEITSVGIVKWWWVRWREWNCVPVISPVGIVEWYGERGGGMELCHQNHSVVNWPGHFININSLCTFHVKWGRTSSTESNHVEPNCTGNENWAPRVSPDKAFTTPPLCFVGFWKFHKIMCDRKIIYFHNFLIFERIMTGVNSFF